MVLPIDDLYVSRSLRKAMRKEPYELTMDTAFDRVIRACARVPRPGQLGTWITDEMEQAYIELHRRGYAHSVEAWDDGTLVGGLYGVSLGAAFFGESMFATAPNASKIAFVTLIRQLAQWSFELVDCQVYTDHLASFGADLWPRKRFLRELERVLSHPTRQGKWTLEVTS
jgi:leucyl/phenylalanyl-tRNA--protein transferase